MRGGPCGGRRGHSYVGAPFPALLRPLPRRAMETTLRQGVRLCPYLSRVVSSGVSASSVGVQHLVHKASMCPVMAGSLNEVHAAVSSPASVMQKAGLSTSRPRARPASRAPASTPTFDYERFYKEQVDLKHRDKRCVFPVTLLLSCFAVNFFCQSVACVLFCFFLLISEHFPISSFLDTIFAVVSTQLTTQLFSFSLISHFLPLLPSSSLLTPFSATAISTL